MTRPAPDIAKDLRDIAQEDGDWLSCTLREAAACLERQHEYIVWMAEDGYSMRDRDKARAVLGGDGQ